VTGHSDGALRCHDTITYGEWPARDFRASISLAEASTANFMPTSQLLLESFTLDLDLTSSIPSTVTPRKARRSSNRVSVIRSPDVPVVWLETQRIDGLRGPACALLLIAAVARSRRLGGTPAYGSTTLSDEVWSEASKRASALRVWLRISGWS
jgi:hypothetical protein